MAEQFTPNSKGPAAFQSEPTPASEEAPGLEPTYVNGVPVLSIGEGHTVPASIDVVDTEGRVVARYTAQLDGNSKVHYADYLGPWTPIR
ncbi:hypothetical protein ABT263_21500 [Kitasatospora sp. NPDC001603]|uniref:hypothetical protein n=1 Tax=Kitasatospora sp. NPDC001603 TaxID=3154388 RepID=UPI00332C2EC8